MQYKRCKCGACERWDTGEAVHPCQGCDKCGTTYAGSPENHKPLEPHDWEPRYNERTGEPDKRMCKRCHKIERLKHLEKAP